MTDERAKTTQDDEPQDELWKRIDNEAEMLRRRTTPVYMKQRIMDALPEEPPAPWYKRIFTKKK